MKGKPQCLVFRHCDVSLQIPICFKVYQGPTSAKYNQSLLLRLWNNHVSQEPHVVTCRVREESGIFKVVSSSSLASKKWVFIDFCFKMVCGPVLSVHSRVIMKKTIAWPLNSDDKNVSIVEPSKPPRLKDMLFTDTKMTSFSSGS